MLDSDCTPLPIVKTQQLFSAFAAPDPDEFVPGVHCIVAIVEK
jgi:hypothetical protein